MTAPSSVLVDATFPCPRLDAQLGALAELLAGTDHELVVVREGEASGRREALALAAQRARHDICIAVGPAVRPLPGALDALADAVAAGAGLAGPVVETAAGAVHGYAAEPDGSLLPLTASGAAPHALPLDCLAARRALFAALPALDPSAGPYESQVAEAATAFGPLAVVAGARVQRTAAGPALSVIVCTQDRVDELRDCVASLVAHGALQDGGEIVIVDSASKDDTFAVARELAATHDGVLAVRDEAGGLSRARMAGAAAARHDVLVFVDDDARPGPGWVESLRDAFCDPEVAVGGGPVHALWPAAPAWRPPQQWISYYSVLTHGDRAYHADLGDFYGTNWAIRRAALDAIGGFDERWGAGAHGSLPGEETAAEHAVRRAGLGRCAYAPGAAMGHRIDPQRLDESWLLARVYRHGLLLPHARAAFADPDPAALQQRAERAAETVLAAAAATGRLDVPRLLDRIGAGDRPLDARLKAARELGVLVRSVWLLGGRECDLGGLVLTITDDDAAGRLPGRVATGAVPQPRDFVVHEGQPVPRVRALAILPVFNEVDVIRCVVEDLIAQGMDVHVLDNRSTDGTPEALADLVGHGVVAIERFPDEAGYDPRNGHQFVLADQLRRFGEIALERPGYDWYVIVDGDEFRESPFPGTTVAEGLGIAQAAGYNAVNFEIYDFRPVDDAFVPGTDVREHITGWEPARGFDFGQVKAWRNPGVRADLSDLHGVGAVFPDRRVFPIPFILRHYSLRGETHGRRKVFQDRLPRFAPDERAKAWHVQYDALAQGQRRFLWDRAELQQWDGDAVRAGLLARAARRFLVAAMAQDVTLDDRQPSTDVLAGWLGRTVLDARPPEADVVDAVAQLPALLCGQAPRPGTERTVLGIAPVFAAQRWASGLSVIAGRLEQQTSPRLVSLAEARTGRFTAVAFADELVAEPELLAGYGRAFGADDDATLVIVLGGTGPEALIAAVEAAGLGDDGPDLLATEELPAPPHAVYSRRADDRFADLPHVDDAEALRRLALAA
jgi:glycosyltransferase involved in cell wall biosynthesis